MCACSIYRDPRWGRGQETPGEDPTLTSDYAANYVSGLQGDDPTYLKASSCIKHYAAYSEEADRNSFPAVVTSQDMADTYLPAFQSGVQHGKASGIMCSCACVLMCACVREHLSHGVVSVLRRMFQTTPRPMARVSTALATPSSTAPSHPAPTRASSTTWHATSGASKVLSCLALL